MSASPPAKHSRSARGAGAGSTPSGRSAVGQKAETAQPYPRLAIGLIICLCLPIVFNLGSLRLTPYRIYLIFALLPLLFAWLAGKAGRYTACDFLVILHVVWATIAMFVIHGPAEALEPTGIYAIEALGAYFVGRVLIRSATELRGLVIAWVAVLVVMIPFVAFESVTGKHILIEYIFGSIFPTIGTFEMEPRWGLSRALGVFEHPILYGVFCGTVLALSWYLLPRRATFFASVFTASPAVITTFFSLSAGPLTSLTVQFFLIGWDYVTRWLPRRWWILLALIVTTYIFIDLASNRSPVEVFISYFTFNAGNAWNRIHIWHFGTAEVWRHPIFGIGLNDWIRGFWMTASMDNFWLVNAVRYGLPGLIFLALAVIFTIMGAAKKSLTTSTDQLARRAWMITICGLALVGATVHFWNQIFCIFMLILGSGNWLVAGTRSSSDGSLRTNKAAA